MSLVKVVQTTASIISTSNWTHSGLKPLSANKAFLGVKVKSKEYQKYESHLLRVLPDIEIPDGLLELRMVVYYSTRGADLDNAVKPFLDCLCKRYGFDDRYVYRIVLTKFIVPKGRESIAFKILPYTQETSLKKKKEKPKKQ
jgi:Holliday junction resolvase RusA-like endonuclease